MYLSSRRAMLCDEALAYLGAERRDIVKPSTQSDGRTAASHWGQSGSATRPECAT